MDFLDNEAAESEEEEELTKAQRRRAQRLKAVESDEDDENEQRYEDELRDLIDDNPIEEGSDGGDSDLSTKKRMKSDEEDLDDRLEDDDYDLIEENLGVKIFRRKRFKRVRQFEDDDERGETGGEDREVIANELFDGGSDQEGDERPERSRERRYDEENFDEEGYSDEEDDFIVDDEGQPLTASRKKRSHVFNDSALQEAQDIFGVEFDFDDFEQYGEEDDVEEDESENEDDYIDDDLDGPRRRKAKKASRKKPTRKSIFDIYEPSELKRSHFTDLDNEIRNTDIPERMQLRDVPVTPVPEGSNELAEEANWIYRHAFCKPSVSTQDCKGGVDPRTMTKKGSSTITKIEKALDFMRNQHFEVPFIAFYRKEYIRTELNVADLWKIYKYDGKWCQLKARKTAMLKLFENTRQFQLEEFTRDINAPLCEDVRVLSEEDIAAVKQVQTPEELKDILMHFQLYYSHLIPKMQEKQRAKEREERRQARQQSRRRRSNVGDDEESTIDGDIEEPNEAEVIKPAARRGLYATYRKAKLEGFAKRFGLKPEQFAENFSDNYQRHEVEQEEVEPIEIAQEYVGSILKTSEDVLQAVKYMVATQISREPVVRKVLRDAVFERARLSVVPTQKGIKEIDENHTCYSAKYLKGKPVRELVGPEYLKLHIAEEDKLLKITFDDEIEGVASASYLEEMKSLYTKDEFSSVVLEWNDLRNDIIELAYKKMLLPDMIKDLRMQLLTEAKECVLKLCSQKLYNWLKVAPFSVEFEEEDDDWDMGADKTPRKNTDKGLRVMGVSYVSDLSQAAFACVVAPDRGCVDHLRLPNLLRKKNYFCDDEKMMKEADLKALRNFIFEKKPHVVCVGSESRDAIMIVQDIKDQISLLVEDEQFPLIPVEILDNNLAKVYANSIKGENDFREYPILLRQAISLARRMQDPLVEFSQLCTIDDEISCLRYHPLQEYVSKEDLMEVVTREFVNRSNEVGVDINKEVHGAHSGNLLQFVCGLGPRKAAALIKYLKHNNQELANRTQLVTVCHMGPKIFINCAGFIKIDTDSLDDSTEVYVEVLDASRIHPETYEWARKMAVDALEYDEEEANPGGALEEILESPDRLKDLDLDAFAQELKRQGFGDKSVTLYDIRNEMNHRYKDLRAAYTSPTNEELFDLLTKETPETFYIGKMIQATVIGFARKKLEGEQLDKANPVRKDETGLWQCPFCWKSNFPELSEVWNHFDAGGCPGQAVGVRIRLDNGVSGCIFLRNLSDKRVDNPEERVQIGQMIYCRILKIDVERFSVEATSKTSDLNENNELKPPKDEFYDYDMETYDKKMEEIKKKKLQTSRQYTKRVIIHPSFYNVNFSECVALMAKMDQGECIFRPSRNATDHLTVTWKVIDNIYQHIDIKEINKPNAFSIGQSLRIGEEEFEDLDEIIARYINPMAAYARDIFAHKYYKDTEGGKVDIAEKILRQEREKSPNKIHYIFSAYAKNPGAFMLFYLPRKSVRYDYLKLTPEGFKLREQIFDSLNNLLKWFKEHFNDRIPYPATPNVMTPHSYPSARNSTYNPQTPMLGMPQMPPIMPPLPHTPHYGTATPFSMLPYGSAYTPGQTPYLTPYQHAPQTPTTQFNHQTPRYDQQTPTQMSFGHRNAGYRTQSHQAPRYGQQTSTQMSFGHQNAGYQTPSHQSPGYGQQTPTQTSFGHQNAGYRTQSHQSPLPRNTPSNPNEWGEIAAEWAKDKDRN